MSTPGAAPILFEEGAGEELQRMHVGEKVYGLFGRCSLGERRGGALSGHTLGRRLADPTRKVGDTEREDEGAATIEERSGEQHNASAGRE